MGTALVPVHLNKSELSVSEQKEFAAWAFKSGEFKSLKSPAHAMLLMQYGRELGFGPATSLQLVYSAGGTPALKANTIAALLKQVRWRDTNAPRYDYRVKVNTVERCVILFLERGDSGAMEERGEVEYTMQDAQRAGLTKNQTYQKYPRQMLFARAITEGARLYAPDCLGGIVPYCPEELGYKEKSEPALLSPDDEKGIIDVDVEPTKGVDDGDVEPPLLEQLLERIRATGRSPGDMLSPLGISSAENMTPSQYRAIDALLKNL